MENLETAERAVAEQEALIADTNAEGARLTADGKKAVAEAQAAHDAATRDREAVAAQVPGDLLALYERLASRGTGAALLVQRTCEGCRMMPSGTDLGTMRQAADDDVLFCPECGCVLVRTEESGL